MSIIIEGSTLSDIGKGLEEKYSNIRFLFQIDFSENDYYILKIALFIEYLFCYL